MNDPLFANATVAQDDRSLLVVVLETSPVVWNAALGDSTQIVDNVMNHLVLFLNAYLALKDDNLIAVVASHFSESRLIYANGIEGTVHNDKPSADNFASELRGKYEQFATMDRLVLTEIKRLVEDSGLTDKFIPETFLARSLSLSLCYINRVLKNESLTNVKPRMLVFSMSADIPSQYIPTMNCIFSAQKLSIPIDVCSLGTTESVFMQQAAQITNGIYVKTEQTSSLLQVLLSVFLTDRHSRKLILLPQKHDVDFRASCFCHKNMVDIGYVCSVCLSIFCSKNHNPCPICGTNFTVSARISSTSVAE